MKTILKSLVVAAVIAVPAVSFAQSQSNGPLTRAQVTGELAQLEQAGYDPGANDAHYPADIQSAEARVAAQNGTAGAGSGYGPSTNGSSASGGGSAVYTPPIPVYFGH
ncbi:hypothetical protein CY652_00740 [Burkholderia sp. WAC0059]|uniref:DUF4148 domain-containing protein n=1 Tax=Burkholderia sp. WAC0059 TaxID=2066022 RepID=UPI000C7F4186|nr:DUF4148 domain-containing protein [Burkholderia sp. WAC0059]PLZ04478.1 hypothetical protein CY652_00740 [Burkholderia sp. WAC0059]